ncbi:MAG: flippase-like domain-containing protein [Bacteroidales bacterium]|nr:flippase-like domain-containing protein [Bacteroidales bacterium]
MNSSKLLLKTLIPVAIGLAVVAWLFAREFDPEALGLIHWSGQAVAGLLLALLFVAGREGGLAWRFRALTDRDMTWGASLRVTMLCEFTSAITPTTAGGSALSMVFMNREGISLGRGTALMMSTLMLDEAFFVIACPLVFLFIPYGEIFSFAPEESGAAFTMGIRAAFWVVYIGIVLWTALLFVGIFIKPQAVRRALVGIFSWRWLRRWQPQVKELGDNMVDTGRDLRHKGWRWWGEAMAATTLSWVSRYLVVNALFWGLVPLANQALVFGRQFVVWTLLTISPTPGGSGVSEWLFTNYYGDMIHDASVALVVAIFWRLISYYIYLAIGVFMIPSVFKSKKTTHQ